MDPAPIRSEAIAAAGLFGTPVCLAHEEQASLTASEVISLESTRATFLSWLPDMQRRFTDELCRILEPQPTVHLTRYTSVTMAQVADATAAESAPAGT